VVNETTAAGELEFVRTNPDAALLEQVFSLARIDYGRIDYGKVDGRIQVYEINTSPRVTGLRTPSDGLRRARGLVVRPRMVDALVAMDGADGAAAGRPAKIPLDPPLRSWRGRLAGRLDLNLRRVACALDRKL
jgi:hypothetical protein